MDGSAFRNMDVGGMIKFLFVFAAVGVVLSFGIFLWSLYLILTWIF